MVAKSTRYRLCTSRGPSPKSPDTPLCRDVGQVPDLPINLKYPERIAPWGNQLMKFASALLLLVFPLSAQAQLPTVTKVNNFGGGPALSPASYAFVRGANFGTAPQVFLSGAQCNLFYITDTFLSIQIPAATPLGSATLTVQIGTGSSASFALIITSTSPAIVDRNLIPPAAYFFSVNSSAIKYPTPNPGDTVYICVDGVGVAKPPVPPEIQIDGKDVPVLLANTFSFPIGPSLSARSSPIPAFAFQIPALAAGPHTLQALAGGLASPPVMFTIIARGLFTSHTGLTFNAAQGGPPMPGQSFSVLTGSGTINFSLTTSTVSGGRWLSANPLTGSSTVAMAGTPIQVLANPSKLSVGTYYGRIVIASPDVPNSPQAVTVVLNVSAESPPSIDRTGVIFTTVAGAGNPPSQAISIFNPGPANVSYTSSLQGTAASFFNVSPGLGSLGPGQSQAIGIQTAFANMPAGISTAKLTLSFSDGTIRIVNLLLVVAPGPATSSSSGETRHAGTSCTPTKLLPVFTLVGDTFSVPAAWPTAVEVTILDDCANPMDTGEVVVSFSNGDPPLRLDPSAPGIWTTTWPPGNPRASVVLTVNATQPDTKLTGTAQISGTVNANPVVPVVSAGGVVETAAYGAPVAPGDLIAIFGVSLSSSSTGATVVPLPNLLLDTQVLIDGQYLPLFYTSPGQVNAVVPYDLSTNAQYQLLLQRDNSLSVPQSVQVGIARPAVFTIDASGTGQGQIYKIDATGNQILVDQNSPAKAGDTLVIYCSGLGAVNPSLIAGTATPLTFLTTTVNTLTATIGGNPAVVNFSGLTPGSTGLYQVNAVVPAGLPNSNTTSLQLTISGQDSPVVTLAVRN